MSENTFNPYQAQLDQLETDLATNRELLADPELGLLAQEEIAQLEAQKQQLLDASEAYLAGFSGEEAAASEEHINCILELRPGAGGDEARIWATDLLRMYTRFAEMLKLKVILIDDFVIKIKGKTQGFLELVNPSPDELTELEKALGTLPDHLTACQIFKYELGVHRVQRVPATEAQGRIHTSTASVAVLPEVSAKTVVIRDEDLELQFMRSSGAGGQSVNKTSSAVRLTHKPTGLVVVSRSERQQVQNRAIAMELLRSQLWELEEEKRLAELGQARSAIGRNMRAEKIRTYNYPQNRVTDHRIKESWHSLDLILEGSLQDVVWALFKAEAVGLSTPNEKNEMADPLVSSEKTDQT